MKNLLKTTALSAILLMFAGVLTSCEEIGKGYVDSEINIRLVETYHTSPRTLQFFCYTTKIYPCINFPIMLELNQESNNINVVFKGVPEDIGICLTAIGPATTLINLGSLNIGTHRLQFQNGNTIHTGELIVTTDSYKINFPNNPDFRFTNTPLNKIPENTIWGIIGWHNEETYTLTQSFLTDLMDLGAEKKPFTPGYYTDFVIDQNHEKTTPDASWGFWFHQLFIFHYSGDINDVKQLLKQYARYHREEISIRISTDKGERFMSWMYPQVRGVEQPWY
ncbi:MAG: hypothetical protein FWC98_05660 [Bacteroidales bacterium]|nr:hypothetical protein [Bacteroidales bacterium]